MSKLVEIVVKLPAPPVGWEYTGEYRIPDNGERYVFLRRDMWEDYLSAPFRKGYPDNSGFILRKKKWRAEQEDPYFHINSRGEVYQNTDFRQKCDNLHWKTGNYFRTKEEAEKAADAFKDFFKQLNLGE